jgi:hypothetical protein
MAEDATSLGDQPGLMAGRHDPMGDFPMEQKLTYLRMVESFLGQSWLASSQGPIVDLWRRKDWIATSELLHFGNAIYDVERQGGAKWLRDHMKRIRTNSLEGARGSVFEIGAASMLGTAGQTVDYAKPSQAGYDLLVTLPNSRRLRISCKVLSASAYAREFWSTGHDLFRSLRECLGPGVPTHITLVSPHPAPRVPTTHELANAVRGIQLIGVVPHAQLGPWHVALAPLRPFSDAEFFETERSLGLTISAPHSPREQRRFDEKVDEACRNLAAHAPPPDETTGNVIFMKVPESVSLDTAIEYAKRGPLSGNTHIAGVLLFRTVVCSNGASFGLGHQFKLINNPAANFPLSHYAPSGTFTINLLTGVPVGGEQLQESAEDPYRLPSPHFYLFDRQHHHYTRTAKVSRKSKKPKNVRCETPPFLLGISCSWTIFGSRRLDIQFMHCVVDRELTLL